MKLDPAIPQCPISLSSEARVIWGDLSEKLVDLKVLTQLDGYVLAMFCEAYVRWDVLRLFLQANGDSYQSENGLHKIRPEVQSLKECLNSLDVLTAKLCLSPEDRGRMSVPNSVKPNPL
ncbi:MAG TPA: phage terminase small subunit P27 family, partial [Candidatus Brocadiaceae bacterium]|nr:phage terminase small subunit P27 family [Candidatus Brocadiaceae bacterium]